MKKEMRKRMGLLIAAAVAGMVCLSGCGGKNEVPAAADGTSREAESTLVPSEAESEEGKETESEETAKKETKAEETAGESKGESTDGMKDQAIMVVSFGTSYNDSRDATIGAIEQAIAEAFPEYTQYRAFTSQIIIDKLKERDGLEIDNVEEALDRAAADGVKTLVVQPTHLMDGFEYMDLANALEEYKDKFTHIALAKPLLSDDEDYEAVIQAITESTSSYDDGQTAICFMGHGTEADSNAVYSQLQDKISEAGFGNYFIGTVEAEPTLEDVMAAMKEAGSYQNVVLEPLMVVAGDHANKDMAGDEEDSWKSILEGEGYKVECILKGLGELPAIQQIYVTHTQAAVDSLK